jgi:hypothetical protein
VIDAFPKLTCPFWGPIARLEKLAASNKIESITMDEFEDRTKRKDNDLLIGEL